MDYIVHLSHLTSKSKCEAWTICNCEKEIGFFRAWCWEQGCVKEEVEPAVWQGESMSLTWQWPLCNVKVCSLPCLLGGWKTGCHSGTQPVVARKLSWSQLLCNPPFLLRKSKKHRGPRWRRMWEAVFSPQCQIWRERSLRCWTFKRDQLWDYVLHLHSCRTVALRSQGWSL